MTAKKTRYTLTAAIGNGQPGSTVDLTEAQAASPLYASRIAPIQGGASVTIDVDALRSEIRDQILDEMEQSIPPFLADAKAKGQKLIEDAQLQATGIFDSAKVEAGKVADAAKTEAASVVEAAKTEAASIIAKAKATASK